MCLYAEYWGTNVTIMPPVSKRCDDKSFCATSVFVTIVKVNISNLNQASINVFNEVETGLLQPFEITR